MAASFLLRRLFTPKRRTNGQVTFRVCWGHPRHCEAHRLSAPTDWCLASQWIAASKTRFEGSPADDRDSTMLSFRTLHQCYSHRVYGVSSWGFLCERKGPRGRGYSSSTL